MGGNRTLLFVGLKKRRYGRPTLKRNSARSQQFAYTITGGASNTGNASNVDGVSNAGGAGSNAGDSGDDASNAGDDAGNSSDNAGNIDNMSDTSDASDASDASDTSDTSDTSNAGYTSNASDTSNAGSSNSLSISSNIYKSSYDPVKTLSNDQVFSNFTTAALSVYLRVSKTSKHDFSTLLKILQDHEFSQKDVPSSFKACRRYIRGLKSLPVQARTIVSKDLHGLTEVEVNIYSIKDILYRALSAPSLASKMYFGPAIKVKKPKEFWHGRLWRQSSLFGEDTVFVRGILA